MNNLFSLAHNLSGYQYRLVLDRLMEWNPYPFLDRDMVEQFYVNTSTHIKYVQEACRTLGISEDQLLIHDQTKFMPVEFYPYAANFYADIDDKALKEKVDADYAYAWLHHIHHNYHHSQHWVFPMNYNRAKAVENNRLVMPPQFVREMVADWVGACRAYNGHRDISEWAFAHVPGLLLHTESKKYLKTALIDCGYTYVVEGLGEYFYG